MQRFSEKEKEAPWAGEQKRKIDGERGEGELESCKRGRTRFPVLNSCREREPV